MTFRVLIRLKPGILDVQGAAVMRALHGLGFEEVGALRVGKLIELDVEATTVEAGRALVEAMCRKLLANPILETHAIEAVAAPASGSSAH